jgi:hypothetical protein
VDTYNQLKSEASDEPILFIDGVRYVMLPDVYRGNGPAARHG